MPQSSEYGLHYREQLSAQARAEKIWIAGQISQDLIQACTQLKLPPQVPGQALALELKALSDILERVSTEWADALATLYQRFADPRQYIDRPVVRLCSGHMATDSLPGLPDIWLLGWRNTPEQEQTDIHDHAFSSAVIRLIHGRAEEVRYTVPRRAWLQHQALSPQEWTQQQLSLPVQRERRQLAQGDTICLGAPHIHRVQAAPDSALGVSMHAYYPPLDHMNYFEFRQGQLFKTASRRREGLTPHEA